jgi:signal-transduction protein with cAMP-binding, CBS, and nucleotidyltransferase domain
MEDNEIVNLVLNRDVEEEKNLNFLKTEESTSSEIKEVSKSLKKINEIISTLIADDFTPKDIIEKAFSIQDYLILMKSKQTKQGTLDNFFF